MNSKKDTLENETPHFGNTMLAAAADGLRKFVWVGWNKHFKNYWVSEPLTSRQLLERKYPSFFNIENDNCIFVMEIFEGDTLIYYSQNSMSSMIVKIENGVFVGDISEVFLKNGYEVRSSDLIDRNYGIVENFFDSDFVADNIVTNPPFKHALEFVLEAKKKSHHKIAMFLKTVFLESEKRKAMFEDKEFPLKTIYQFSKRVTLYKDGVKMKNSGMIAYAWYVWEKGYCGKPTIEWI